MYSTVVKATHIIFLNILLMKIFKHTKKLTELYNE